MKETRTTLAANRIENSRDIYITILIIGALISSGSLAEDGFSLVIFLAGGVLLVLLNLAIFEFALDVLYGIAENNEMYYDEETDEQETDDTRDEL